jgi:hypothetical protein
MVNTLNIEDKLEGVTNFCAWKARVLLLLEENDLKEYVEGEVVSPTDPRELTTHKKKEGQTCVARIHKGSLDYSHC